MRRKNIWRRKWISVIVLLTMGLLSQQLSYARQDLALLDSSDQGVTIEYCPRIERIDTVQLRGENYFKIYIANASLVGDPGDPMTPVKVFHVGIPLESETKVSIVATESGEITGRLLPAPAIDRSGKYDFNVRSDNFQTVKYFPQQLLVVDEPGFIRDQRVVKIKLFALQSAGALERIKIHHKIIIRVDFIGNSSRSSETRGFADDDEFYSGVVVNYDQSKKWLKKHIPYLKRSKTQFQNENWYKIFISQEGIYKITGQFLSSQGIDISSINAESIQIYNNGGRELPRNISIPRPDSLIENAIQMVDLNSNGKIDSDDYILFYGKSVNNWEQLDTSDHYRHYINHYTHENVYWLTWNNSNTGKRMKAKSSLSIPGLNPAADFWGLYYNEDEINNYLNSGYHWFGRLLTLNSQQQSYSAYLPNPANRENNVYFKIQCLGMSYGSHNFTVYLNDQLLHTFSFTGSYSLKTFEVRRTISLKDDVSNILKIVYNGSSTESQAYIDWFEIQYRRQFVAADNYLIFNQAGNGIQQYRVTNFPNDQIAVYDITDWADVKIITNTEISNGTVSFVDSSSDGPARQYIALTPEAFRQPNKIEAVRFSDLRNAISGADFIIISHDEFYDAVLPLKQHRETHDTLKTEVVKISDIYNEFSWGLVDAVAIRDFVKFAFDHWNPVPKYVLLCGDGDYDYRNIKSKLDRNWIPPFQTTELHENSNRTMDEFFVLVSGNDNKPDLAIGRFPVQTAEETENVVTKIIHYETAPYWSATHTHPLEDWRNIVTMVGDDEYHDYASRNETMHTRDAELIMENYIPPSFNKEKIYLMEYAAIKDPSTSGFRKPAANEALIKRINNGTLILNYIGHGAPDIWADERVLLTSRDFDRIQNYHKLPLWVAATCDFGRFDDPMEQGLAEKLFVAKDRGGIAFMTSARLAYATDNTELNRNFYNQLFKSDYGPTERLGVALINAKIDNYSDVNDQKYHLFGDPTMRLAMPQFSARINAIQPDTLKALSEIKVTGQVQKQNRPWQDLEGKALLKIFDSKTNKIYTTEFGSQIHYIAPGKTIFRGTISVKQGQFEARFIVPKDITYGGRHGRISIYFANQQIHGSGFRDNLLVGGTSVLQDTEGPIIQIGFEGQNFVPGNTISKNSILEVEIADSISGINIAGDIGHNITMVIDDQQSNEIVLTDLFNYYEGNFKAGKILYDFSNYKNITYDQNNNLIEQYGLTPGFHTVTIKAWDNFNNSSISSVDFVLVADEVLQVSNVFNYPNPFTSATTFTYAITHNAKVNIKIYTVAGRLIETLANIPGERGMNHFYWEARDRNGDELANGIYLYKIIATTQNSDKNLKDEYIGKLVIAR